MRQAYIFGRLAAYGPTLVEIRLYELYTDARRKVFVQMFHEAFLRWLDKLKL